VGSGGRKKARIRCGAHWRHLANISESSMCGGDAVFSSNYLDHFMANYSYTSYCTSKLSLCNTDLLQTSVVAVDAL